MKLSGDVLDAQPGFVRREVLHLIADVEETTS
jgi:hypothetical protein